LLDFLFWDDKIPLTLREDLKSTQINCLQIHHLWKEETGDQ